MLISSDNKAVVIKSSLIPKKNTRTSVGVQIMSLKAEQKIVKAYSDFEGTFENAKGYRKLKIPATGVALTDRDVSAEILKSDET